MTISNNYPPAVNRILAAMLLILVVRCLDAGAYRAASAPGGLFSVDFGAFYAAAHRLNAGQRLYVPEEGQPTYQYVSSPLMPELLRPAARMSLEEATRAWAAVNVVLLTLAVFLYCWGAGIRVLDQAGVVVLILVTGFRFWPTTLELGIGNSDIVILTLAAGMFVCSRYGRWFLFALLVAVAALTKTWMIGALFYLVMRRKWGAALAGAGFLAGGLALLFCIVGWAQLPVFLQVTHAYSSQPVLVSNSVTGIARLYFTNNPIISPLIASRALWAAAMVAGYGFLIGGLGYLWLRAPMMKEGELQLTLGLCLLALVLGCPVSHQYYFVLALPLIWSLMLPPAGVKAGWVLPVMAFAIYLVFSVPTQSMNPVPETYRHGMRSLNIATSFCFGMLLWGCGVFSVVRGLGERQVQASAPADQAAEVPGVQGALES